jgi:hypothetical protein
VRAGGVGFGGGYRRPEPSDTSFVSAFSGGGGFRSGGGATAPALAPPPLVSQGGLRAFEACYRAFAGHALAPPARVLPAATVAGLALQALTGAPSPPFLDLQPAPFPAAASGRLNAAGDAWCSNWRIEVR